LLTLSQRARTVAVRFGVARPRMVVGGAWLSLHAFFLAPAASAAHAASTEVRDQKGNHRQIHGGVSDVCKVYKAKGLKQCLGVGQYVSEKSGLYLHQSLILKSMMATVEMRIFQSSCIFTAHDSNLFRFKLRKSSFSRPTFDVHVFTRLTIGLSTARPRQ
jgi:hypothetical protein